MFFYFLGRSCSSTIANTGSTSPVPIVHLLTILLLIIYLLAFVSAAFAELSEPKWSPPRAHEEQLHQLEHSDSNSDSDFNSDSPYISAMSEHQHTHAKQNEHLLPFPPIAYPPVRRTDHVDDYNGIKARNFSLSLSLSHSLSLSLFLSFSLLFPTHSQMCWTHLSLSLLHTHSH